MTFLLQNIKYILKNAWVFCPYNGILDPTDFNCKGKNILHHLVLCSNEEIKCLEQHEGESMKTSF